MAPHITQSDVQKYEAGGVVIRPCLRAKACSGEFAQTGRSPEFQRGERDCSVQYANKGT